MDKFEAIQLLDQQISDLQRLPYATFEHWQQKKHVEVFNVESKTKRFYTIEVQAAQEDTGRGRGIIRVIVSIDDSHIIGMDAKFPVTKSFLMAPNNSIIKE
jgi:hypothetical protein